MKTLSEYQARLEALEVDLNRETYRQYAGLPYDESRMEHLSAEIERLAGAALAAFPPDDFPRPLLYATIRSSRASEYTRLDNEIYRLRSEGVTAEEADETVNLNNWRLFNRRHVRDAGRRRRVFVRLLERTPALTPVLAEGFALSRDLTGRHGLTPLDIYLEEEGIDFAALERLIDQTAAAARPLFEGAMARFAEDLLGKPPEFYDDFYVFTNVIYEPVDRFLQEVNFDRLLGPIYEGLGFSLSQIGIDGEPRSGKHASPALSYVDRYLIPAGVAEIFSTLFESLGTTPRFLAEEIGLTREAIDDLLRRERFMELYFLTFYGANSMFKLRYWTEHPGMDAADRLYAGLYRRYVGLAMPGRYWQTHHVVALHDVYAPSYLLAKVRMVELRRVLEERFGERWWRNPEAGRFLREALMGPGRSIALETFSRLDPGPYLNSLDLSTAGA